MSTYSSIFCPKHFICVISSNLHDFMTKLCLCILQLMKLKTPRGSFNFPQVILFLRDGCQWETLLVHEFLQGKEGFTPPDACLTHVWSSWSTYSLPGDTMLKSTCCVIPRRWACPGTLRAWDLHFQNQRAVPSDLPSKTLAGSREVRMVCSFLLYPEEEAQGCSWSHFTWWFNALQRKAELQWSGWCKWVS